MKSDADAVLVQLSRLRLCWGIIGVLQENTLRVYIADLQPINVSAEISIASCRKGKLVEQEAYAS